MTGDFRVSRAGRGRLLLVDAIAEQGIGQVLHRGIGPRRAQPQVRVFGGETAQVAAHVEQELAAQGNRGVAESGAGAKCAPYLFLAAGQVHPAHRSIIGIDQGDRGAQYVDPLQPQCLSQYPDPARFTDIVRIHPYQIFSLCPVRQQVQIERQLADRRAEQADACIPGRMFLQGRPQRIGAGVGRDQELEIAILLRQHAVHGLRQPRIVVLHGHDDREAGGWCDHASGFSDPCGHIRQAGAAPPGAG